MAFCTKCGTPLNAAGVCTACTPAPAAAPAPAPTPVPAPVPTPVPAQPQQPQNIPVAPPQPVVGTTPQQPAVVYVKSAPNPIVTEAGTCLKGFFSANPHEAVTFAGATSSHIWAIFGGISIVAAALAFMLIPVGLLGDAMEYYSDGAGTYFSLFGCGILLSLMSFMGVSGCVKAVFAIFKLDVSFIRVMNMVAAASLLSALASVAAILFSFVFADLSFLLLMVGGLGSIVLLYVGIQKAANFSSSPFWLFLGVCALDIIVLYVTLTRMAESSAFGFLGRIGTLF